MEKGHSLGKRVEEIREAKKVDLDDFLAFLKYEKNSYNTLKSDKSRKVSMPVMLKLKSKYPDINLNWLVTGEGEMFLNEGNQGGINQIITNGNGNVQIQNLEKCKDALENCQEKLREKEELILTLKDQLADKQAIIELQKNK